MKANANYLHVMSGVLILSNVLRAPAAWSQQFGQVQYYLSQKKHVLVHRVELLVAYKAIATSAFRAILQ